MIYVISLCVILLILGLVVSKDNIFSPCVLTPGIWLACLSLFLMLEHNLPHLGHQFLTGISLWLICFCFFSMLTQSVNFSVSTANPSQLVRDIYFWSSICTFPLLLLFVYNAVRLGDPSISWTWNVRLAVIGKTDYFKESYSPFYTVIWQAAYLIELFFYSKKNRNRVFILAFLSLFFATITFSKYLLLQFFVTTIIILYFKHKVNLKHVLFTAIFVLFCFFSLQAIRHSLDLSDVKSSDFLVLYSIGHMSAFETVEPNSSAHWGENVFRLFYAIVRALGNPIEPINPILPFIQKPLTTNTYTTLYPFFKDFGYFGIILFAAILGAFFGWLFKKAQKGDTLFVLFFSYLSFCVVMQFMSEVLFTNLSGYIKTLIMLGIAFWSSTKIYYKDERVNT